MIIFNIEQGSEAWHSARAGRVTGTRFSGLMMGENTKGYKDLVISLTGEILTGVQEETYSNAIMQRGLELEPIARKNYEEEFGKVKEVGFIIPEEDNEYHNFIGVSPDGISEGLVEIKCPLMKTHLNYMMKGKLPSEYRYQVQGQLFVTGLPYCDFVSYYPGMKLFVVRVEPDLELFEQFRIRLKQLVADVGEALSAYSKYSLNEHDYSL